MKHTVLPNGLDLAYVSREDVHFLYKEIFVDQTYLKHGLQICPGNTVIDVGANLGLFSIFAAGLVGFKVSESNLADEGFLLPEKAAKWCLQIVLSLSRHLVFNKAICFKPAYFAQDACFAALFTDWQSVGESHCC